MDAFCSVGTTVTPIRNKVIIPLMLLLSSIFNAGVSDAAGNSTHDCLLFPEEGAVISQRTVMQEKLSHLHSVVGEMLRPPEEMTEADVPQVAKDWMTLMLTDGLDFSFPKPILCVWGNPGEKLQQCRVEVAETSDFKEDFFTFYPKEKKNCAEVHSLKSGTKYYWRVSWVDADNIRKNSPARSFSTAVECPRWVRLDGLSNVRDFGGWSTVDGRRIRQGLLYRGPEMNGKINIAPDGMQFLVENLHLRTDIDIRGPKEMPDATSPCSPLPDSVQWFHIPLSAYAGVFTPEQQDKCASIFRLLLDPKNHPCYIHCQGGADRTGTIILLLGGVLGMTKENLLVDYELTSIFSAYRGIRYRARKAFLALLEKLAETTGEETIQKQCEKYFLDSGITPEEIARFRALFLQ